MIKIRYSQAPYVITPINTSNANGIKWILNSNKHCEMAESGYL